MRPIAVGNILKRLVAKTIMQKLSNFSTAFFKPHQLGAGTPSRAEVAAHLIRKYIFNKNQHGCNSENEIILKIDFKNAFNSIRRDVVFKEIQKKLPTIYPIFCQAFSCPSILFYGDSFLLSQEGVQQGDPLGPFLFSLAIQNLINECKSELNIWYLDDGTVAGNAEDVLSDFNKIINAKETLQNANCFLLTRTISHHIS